MLSEQRRKALRQRFELGEPTDCVLISSADGLALLDALDEAECDACLAAWDMEKCERGVAKYERDAAQAAACGAVLVHRYRKKPVVVEAKQWWPGQRIEGVENVSGQNCGHVPPLGPHIHTLEGTLEVSPGDWVIKGVAGELYPCKPDIFALTYEPIDAPL